MRNTSRFAKKKAIVLVLLFLICIGLFGYSNSVYYPESSIVRSQLVASWFMQDIETLRTQSYEIIQNELGEQFLVHAVERDGVMEIILAPLVVLTVDVQNIDTAQGYTDQSAVDTRNSVSLQTWPSDAMGSWILYRDVITGRAQSLRCYFTNNKEVYLEFFPGKEKSYANFSIYGALVAHNAPIPVPFEYFYTASLRDIKKITSNTLPWKYVEIDNNVYSDTMQMVQVIRRILPEAQKADMFVSDTSSYDFLRWIIDGLVRPLTGGLLYEEPLFLPTVTPEFMIPERQNTHKSFDFVRNIAAAAISAGTSLTYTYETSKADVKIEPFSVMEHSNGVQERVNFVTDIGYQVSVLEPLLYLLTATEDDLFYLGAVRELQVSTESGRNSEQYFYNNAVAFFSWFDANGKFNISVFENGAEFTLEQFLQRYEDCFVYLVRVKPSANFFPEEPMLEEEDLEENNSGQ